MKNLLLLLFIVCACSSKHNIQNTQGRSVYLQRTDKIQHMKNGSELFSAINLIPLKEDDLFLFNNVDKIIKFDSSFYLLDKKMKIIYKYDTEGNPLKRFFKVGGSSNEYLDIIDFDVNIQEKELIVLCIPPKILHTDLDLNLKKNVLLEANYFDRIVSWKNKIFLYNHRERVVKSIDKDEKLAECFRTTEMKNDLMDNSSSAFYKTQNSLYFQSPGDDCIYKLDEDNFIPYIGLDFDNKKATIEMYNKKYAWDITMDDRLAYPIPYIKSIIETEDKLIFIYLHGIIARMCTYSISKNQYIDQIPLFFSMYPNCFSSNALYGIEDPHRMGIFKIPEFAKFMEGVKYDFTGKLDFDDDFDNPVIVEQILK